MVNQSREKCSSFLNRVEEVLAIIIDAESTKKVKLQVLYQIDQYIPEFKDYIELHIVFVTTGDPLFVSRFLKLCRLERELLKKIRSAWKMLIYV